MPDRRKVVICGIDGATWNIIMPWVEEGLLPNFADLIRTGRWGNLLSTVPPVTAPAWTSMTTGQNPGKHGLFDFISHAQGTYGVNYRYGGQRNCETIWKRLSDHGVRVGVVNVPMTYPPEPVNGYMISGMDTPDEASPFIFPSDLKDEICRDLGPLRLDIRHLGYMDNDEKRLATLKELVDIEKMRLRLIEYLNRNHPADVVMFVMNAVDQVQHHFWHFMDKDHPRFDPEKAQQFDGAVLQIYQEVDGILGEVRKIFGAHCHFMLVSDHGFQAASNSIIHVNKALADAGLLTFKKAYSPSAFFLDRLSGYLIKRLSPVVKQKIAKLLPNARAGVESKTITSLIDWGRTKAYSFENLVTSPNVWINIKGKRPEGIVDQKDYDLVVAEVKQCLLGLKNPETGLPVIERVLGKNDVFIGPAVAEAPDVIPCWWEGSGFTPRPSVKNGKVVQEEVVRCVKEKIEGGNEWGGTHSAEGIVLISGPGIKPGHIENAEIVDVAPTVFHLLDISGDAAFDGKSMLKNELPYVYRTVEHGGEGSESRFGDTNLSEADSEKIKKRLKMLGYLD